MMSRKDWLDQVLHPDPGNPVGGFVLLSDYEVFLQELREKQRNCEELRIMENRFCSMLAGTKIREGENRLRAKLLEIDQVFSRNKSNQQEPVAALESKEEELSFDPEAVIRSALSKQTEAVEIIRRQRGTGLENPGFRANRVEIPRNSNNLKTSFRGVQPKLLEPKARHRTSGRVLPSCTPLPIMYYPTSASVGFNNEALEDEIKRESPLRSRKASTPPPSISRAVARHSRRLSARSHHATPIPEILGPSKASTPPPKCLSPQQKATTPTPHISSASPNSLRPAHRGFSADDVLKLWSNELDTSDYVLRESGVFKASTPSATMPGNELRTSSFYSQWSAAPKRQPKTPIRTTPIHLDRKPGGTITCTPKQNVASLFDGIPSAVDLGESVALSPNVDDQKSLTLPSNVVYPEDKKSSEAKKGSNIKMIRMFNRVKNDKKKHKKPEKIEASELAKQIQERFPVRKWRLHEDLRRAFERTRGYFAKKGFPSESGVYTRICAGLLSVLGGISLRTATLKRS